MANLAVSLVLVSLVSGCCCVPLAWEEVPVTGLVRNRWLAASAFVNGVLYMFGGEGNRLGTNDTGILGEA